MLLIMSERSYILNAGLPDIRSRDFICEKARLVSLGVVAAWDFEVGPWLLTRWLR
jgi:hypothetical protein